jgi:hypothetical protein
MLSSILKRKLSDDQVSNIFINAIFDTVDNGFKEVAHIINEDPVFVVSPNVQDTASGEFALIVIVGNLSFLESTFDSEQATRVEKLIFAKLAKVYEMPVFELSKLIRDYQSFISRINHPSKNMIYGMSKALFFKYNLNEFQDAYFCRLNTPNPLFLKRMDEIMVNFIWNWDAFFKKYKLNS